MGMLYAEATIIPAGGELDFPIPDVFPSWDSVFVGWLFDEGNGVKQLGLDDLYFHDGLSAIADSSVEPVFVKLSDIFEGFYSVNGGFFITGVKDNSAYTDFVMLPRMVTVIGERAFRDSELSYILFEDGSRLIEIGDYAFENSAIRNIEIPASVRNIGEYAFSGCEELTEVSFQDNCELIMIGDCFLSGSSILDITIPDSVTSLGPEVFAGSTVIYVYCSENLFSTVCPPDSEDYSSGFYVTEAWGEPVIIVREEDV